MSLANLLKIGQLKSHTPTRQETAQLLTAARRNLSDADVEIISCETRFDSAYKAIMQTALVALMASGYRPDTNRPGHQMTMVQSPTLTIGLSSERMVVLDALRRRRNLADYTGAWIDEAVMVSCIAEAKALVAAADAWLRRRHPELL